MNIPAIHNGILVALNAASLTQTDEDGCIKMLAIRSLLHATQDVINNELIFAQQHIEGAQYYMQVIKTK